MFRKIIAIDEEKCNGCGACAAACHENAIEMVSGKAKLTRENNCDGLGDCLPACPVNAIVFKETDAPAYEDTHGSRLSQWPVQIKLVSENAPYFNGADLLIAADCTAYAYGNFHNDFIRGRITLIGCPKLDGTDYSNQLTAIFTNNTIQSVTVTRMTVPCCGGLERAVRKAIQASGKQIPYRVVTISADGKMTE